MVASTIAQDEPSGLEPTDIWSDDYIDTIFYGRQQVTELCNSKSIIHMRQ